MGLSRIGKQLTMEQNDFVQDSASSSGLAALDQLENRLQGAIEQFQGSRKRQLDAERDATEAKGLLSKKDDEIERLTREVEELRGERDQVRKRIETLLSQVEALDASGS
jgi:chromosome segregation ATPase